MRWIFYPLSIIYGIIIKLRNLLFDYGICKSVTHKIPIICVGNLSAGGSGKTPHTDYIVKALSRHHKIAILSRGYGRKSSGFNYISLEKTTSFAGDEPLMLKHRNPNCIVAVNSNRNQAVKRILIDHPETKAIVLDDGYQHRQIKAGINIIITPFHKLYTKNRLLPFGTLREQKAEAKRADIIVISSTPITITDTEKKRVIISLKAKAYQRVHFSSIKYLKYRSLINNSELENEQEFSVTLVTGIANPMQLLKHLKNQERKVKLVRFPDHHNYTPRDIRKILSVHMKNKSRKKLILTTEKDAYKLKEYLSILDTEMIYYIPINIFIHNHIEFEQPLLDYVKRKLC